MTPTRTCYDLVSAATSIAVPAFAAGYLCSADVSGEMRIVGLLLLGGLILWPMIRLARQAIGLLGDATDEASKILKEPPHSFRTAEAGLRHLVDQQRQIRSFLSEQQVLHARVERDLGASASLLETAYAALSDAVLVIDTSDRLVLVNPAAESIFGLRSEHLNRPLVEVLRSPQLHDIMAEAKRSQATTTGRVDLVRAGRITTVVASPLPDPPGGIVLLVHDETELRRLERMRRDFVSNVSHELKTPLTSIQAFADTLLDGGIDDPETAQAFLGKIVGQADRLGTMIVDMLDLARLETEAAVPDASPIRAEEIISRAIGGHAVVAEANGVLLSQDVQQDAYFLGDEATIRTILDNLIKNAIEHTPATGSVLIRVDSHVPPEDARALSPIVRNSLAHEHLTTPDPSPAYLCIHVKDTGHGIPRDLQKRVFERFFRADKSRNRQLGGSGLGLAIVKHAAERLGGVVSLDSKVGEGSTFHVTLPAASLADETASVAAGSNV